MRDERLRKLETHYFFENVFLSETTLSAGFFTKP
jgi:hypothetical protein